MAVLIPRKQIEEQKDFTGSLDIGGNLTVSGSFILSQSFFFGDNLTTQNKITGSVELTGSLNIDGEFLIKNASTTIQSLTASQAVQALQSFDTTKYGGILARDFGANVPTLYVSATDGDDSNDGRTIQFPLKTVKRAAQLATPGFDGRYGLPSGSAFSGYVIRVQAGTYIEDNPVILPKNTSIWGSGLRITKVLAKNPEQDLFWVDSGCYVAEITMGGLRLWPNQIEPERGFGIAFRPGAFITTSPYVQNCSQISNQENSFTELYEDIPPGGGGLYVNGDVINPDSPLASMVLDAYTQISPNGVGCLVNGRGFIQLVSFFTNFAYYAIRVNNGGHATLNNSNISFGLYGMYASGSRKIDAISGGNEDARQRVRNSYSIVVDVLNKGLEEGLPATTTLNTAEGIKVTAVTQSYTLLDASQIEIDKVTEDFRLVSEIVKSGIDNYPALLAKSSNKGYDINNPYNILGATQITSSVSASNSDLTSISASFAAILSIFADGTGSYNLRSNTSASIKRTDFTIIEPISAADNSIKTNVSQSFDTIVKILAGGASPIIVPNTSASLKLSNETQYLSGVSSNDSTINAVSASFSIIYNILDKGTGSSIIPIPNDHRTSYDISRSGSNAAFLFDGVGANPTITLFRGLTYKFYVSASVGKDTNPLFIRTQPISGFTPTYDYNNGVVNNGEDFGNITFTVPYNAPNELYYVSQNSPSMVGKFNIVNSSSTPFDLIANTLTYPKLVSTGSEASKDPSVHNAYNVLQNNKTFIKEETIKFVSSSWSDFDYNEVTCKRDIGYIIDAVSNDLLYGGNSQSITAGLFYYLYPSDATTTQKDPTLTAIKYVSGISQNLIKNIEFVDVLNDVDLTAIKDISDTIIANREFFQNETIAYLSSSWSTFEYNEAKCKRDVGYIVDAVATDLLYKGNERSVTAGEFYYKYPSEATSSQLVQTIDGIRFALGNVLNVIEKKTFQTASLSTREAYSLLRNNRQLIQNETIQFINTTYPTLEYNQVSCSRDTGYIIDSVATDLLYGGIERGVKAGRFYYDVPSIATSRQKTETIAGIRYAKVLADSIVQNTILETPRLIKNTETGIKVSALNNVTSSVSGRATESEKITQRFNIIADIVRKGSLSIPSAIAKNTNLNWGISNPLNVSTSSQQTSSFELPSELDTLSNSWDLVTSIIEGGTAAIPTLTSSADALVKVTDTIQTTGSFVSSSATSSISSSFGAVINVLENGLTALPTLVLNTSASVKVTGLDVVAGTPATNTESSSISSSFSVIEKVLLNGLSALPTLVTNTAGNIKVSATAQFTSASSGNSTHVAFLSSSFKIVTDILESGNLDLYESEEYVTRSVDVETVAAYNILKENIDFIQDETIAYLSSSWRGFDYNEAKCRRDLGYIISGAAEDLIYGANKQSIINGQFYYEFPSQATGSQLIQTLDGINYASRLAQKVVTSTTYVSPNTNKTNAASILVDNKEFIQAETIAYISSSWSTLDYNEVTCKRDLGYIIDAVATDLIYGGNERTRKAAEFYYLYPSEATGSQLLQTVDAINYASRLAQKISVGGTFVAANSSSLEASRLLVVNNNLIANEVVEYVSSSWSGVSYNEIKCKRDVKYILDAVRTDLVYGGNERTRKAAEFYYLYPSSATVGGVPSATAQLDPTVTGIAYGSRLAQNIVKSRILSKPSVTTLDIAGLIRANRTLLQTSSIDFVSYAYPDLTYDVARCFRDVGFITDGVVTDLVYGGNERSSTSGLFYYKFPSKATNVQVEETVDAINFAKDLSRVIALEGSPIEKSFNNVLTIIKNGKTAIPTIVETTSAGIKGTTEQQTTLNKTVVGTNLQSVSSSFGNVINIISKGTGSIPTIIENTIKGVSRIAKGQYTSSLNASITEQNLVSSSFDIVLDIVENGTGSLPTIVDNASGLVKVTSTPIVTLQSQLPNSVSNRTTSSFDVVLNIIENGTGSLPTLISNTNGNIKVGSVTQSLGTAASNVETASIANLFDIVSNIIENGTGSLPTLIPYVTPSVETNTVNAYNNLKNNIAFIQSETIAYLSSSWTGFEYDESKCRRDIGFIVSGAAEDLLWNSNSASLVNGKFYYEFPSQAQTTQLNQTLDGVNYAKRLAEKIILNTTFVTASSNDITASNLIESNKGFIKDEVIAYISSSWSEFQYNSTTCKRDVGYILDAIKTDLVYGGNERSIEAGRFYYLYPSEATTTQLGPTLTGVKYAKGLVKQLLLSNTFQTASLNKQTAYNLIKENKFWIQEQTIAKINSDLTLVSYNEPKCKRDVGYILDAVATDLLYGGNERSVEAGEYYYLYPSAATGSQLTQTLEGIGYAKQFAYTVVGNEYVYSQVTSSITTSTNERNKLTSSFDLVIDIIENGTGSIPTIITNADNNIKRTNLTNFTTSSIIPSSIITSSNDSFDTILDIVENGTGSLPYVTKNTIGLVKLTNITQFTSSLISSNETVSSQNSKFDIVLDIVENGTGSYTASLIPYLTASTDADVLSAYNVLKSNIPFIVSESIAYLSSSWSSFAYNQASCSRDIAFIVSGAAEDLLWNSNSASIVNGKFYYEYPSEATGSQLQQTLDGIRYAKNLSDRLARGAVFTFPSSQKLAAKELISQNKNFIANEAVAYVSASWNGFQYNEVTCKRDVGYILDAVITDIVYGGNERSVIAGQYYYDYPSEATTTQLGPTLSGITHAKNLTKQILKNSTFSLPSTSAQNAYNLLLNNKELIQNETIGFLNSAWSFFEYSESKCRRDVGYIVDAVATDILYGGNEASARAGEYYYLYPSLATVDGDGDSAGQLGQTIDGIKFAKGISQKIVSNTLLVAPTTSEKAAWELINKNKQLIQRETIAYLSSSWSGVGGFTYNEASCSRDVAYILDAVATDLVYGGNERSSKAGEYYFLYPSAATVSGSISPSTTAQLGPTVDGISFAAGVTNKILRNIVLKSASNNVLELVDLLKQNKLYIQNETIEFIDAYYPYLVYNREKCRRDVGFILDAVITDLKYGGNERGVVAGEYYFRYPNKATTAEQITETLLGIFYAKQMAKKVVQNGLVNKPQVGLNIDSAIKVTSTTQYTSSISSGGVSEVNSVSQSISLVNTIIRGGEDKIPTIDRNIEGLIKVNTTYSQITSSISASSSNITSSISAFGLIRDIVYNGTTFIPDGLVSNYKNDYGLFNVTPNVWNISSLTQSLSNVSGSATSSIKAQTDFVTSSFDLITNIVEGGVDEIPTIIKNTKGNVKVTNTTIYSSSFSGSNSDIVRINSLYDVVLKIVQSGSEAIPTLYSNSTSSIKVTNTPQAFSSSNAERIHGKIISSSFAVVSTILQNGTSSVSYRTGSATPNSNTKVLTAYNLLTRNAPFIIDETIAFMSSSWSEFSYSQSKCERDLGLIISGAAYDLLYGGNSASLVNGKFYFEYPSEATSSQIDQTLTAIGYAAGLAEKVVQGVFYQHISSSQLQTTSASYTLIRKNKQFIKDETISFLSSSWSEFVYNQASCSRDIGYIIDAVSTDLLYGGNERSIVAGDYYYRFPSAATGSQLDQTLDGIEHSKGLAANLASGSIPQTASFENDYVYDLISTNKNFIRSEALAYVNAKYEDLVYDSDKCYRDLGYIIDAVRTDVLYGGNQRSARAGEFYYLFPSKATGSQLTETLDAINYAGLVTDKVIKSDLLSIPQVIQNTSASIKVTNTNIVTGSAATQTEATLVSASIAIVANIIQYGSGSYPTASTKPVTPLNDANIVNAYNLIKNNIAFIQNETIAYISSSWSSFGYNEASCSRDVGLIISGAIEDVLYGVNSASIVNGKFYLEYPSAATGSQLNQTLDGISYASRLAQKIAVNTTFVTPSAQTSASYQLMRTNRNFIADEVVSYVSSSWSGADYNEVTCKRDVGYIIDAVSTDLLYGGNERSVIAGQYYYDYPSQATTAQKEPTATAIEYASDLAEKVIQNKVFQTASLAKVVSRELLRLNKPFIQNETIAYISSSWSQFAYNEASCSRDTGYIIDAVATDLLYGGNERSVIAGQYYYDFPSEATTVQLEPTVDGVTYAGRVAQKIIQNVLFQTASIFASASADLLTKNRAFIQAEVIEYVSSSWSQVKYNEASCSRDVGFLIDAVRTDLLYGGEERTVNAADFYYRFPSRATVAGVPSETNQLDPTLTGIRYAGGISSRIVLNSTFSAPSQSVITAKQLLIGNKRLIQAETIAYLSSSWSTLKYNEVSCSRDVGYILDGVVTDLVYGGNESSIQAGSYYYLIPSVAIKPSYTDNGEAGQKIQTVDGINFARGIAEKVIAKKQLVFPGQRRLEAAQRLLAAKDELKRRALSYTNGAFPFLVYNEASCSRDTGLIVDALVTDLVYGGNERGIAAASSYYNGQYGSAIAVTRDQRLETLETNRYLRTRAEFIAANAPLEDFGSLIVATGIDYSYNGSGVTFKALPPNQGGSGVPDPDFEITELGGGRIFFTSGNQDGDFRIGTGLSINQATGTLVGRTFSKSLFSLVTPFSLALEA